MLWLGTTAVRGERSRVRGLLLGLGHVHYRLPDVHFAAAVFASLWICKTVITLCVDWNGIAI
jgi:hypothetical protein